MIATALNDKGGIVDEALAYRTVAEKADRDATHAITRFQEEGADLVTFASSSAVKHFQAMQLSVQSEIKGASLGPITSASMKEAGISIELESAAASIEAFVDEIVEYFQGRSTDRRSRKD